MQNAVDIFPAKESLKSRCRLIAYFPDTIPETNTANAAWESLTLLAAAHCIVITGMSSAEAERFDKRKPPAWHRMGDIKRKGFRAMAYRGLAMN